jgi:hypothetical protein
MLKRPLLRSALRRAIAPPPALDPTARQMFLLGRDCAPLFCGLVEFVLDEAAREGFERVYYFTREGEFFAAIHRGIQAAQPAARLPAAEVLEVSRLATFLPSLAEVSLESLRPLWQRYPRQTPAAILASLNLDPQPLSPLLEEHGLPLTETTEIERPWEDARVQALFGDARFQSHARTAAAEQRAALLGYLQRRGIAPQSPRVCVADIGWRGTVHDNLARLLPQTLWHGCYLGLQRDRSPEPQPPPPNVVRRSFVAEVVCRGRADGMAYEFLKFVGPMEMLCNSPRGTVAGYAQDGGEPRTLRRNCPAEDRVYHEFVRHFQAGVLAAVPLIARQADAAADGYRAFQGDYWRILRTLMVEPPRAVARAHAALRHDETFGVGGAIEMGRRLPIAWALKAAFSPESRQRLLGWVYSTPWPQGLLVARNLGVLCKWLNWRYFRALYSGNIGP